MNEALKMTQRVKHLWPKHKDLSSDPQNQCETRQSSVVWESPCSADEIGS